MQCLFTDRPEVDIQRTTGQQPDLKNTAQQPDLKNTAQQPNTLFRHALGQKL